MPEAEATIVITTWNRAQLLRRALESVLRQTVENIEIFVADNGSTDETPAVVATFEDPRIVYSRVENNLGLHGGLNRALGLGTAPIIAILHDDDLYYPRNVEAKLAIFKTYETVGATYSAFDVLNGRGGIVARNVTYGGRPRSTLIPGPVFRRRAMSQLGLSDFSAMMFRRSAVANECFDERDGLSCDLGLHLRVSTGWDFGFVDESLTGRAQHEESVSARSGIESPDLDERYGVTISHVAGVDATKRRFLDRYGFTLEDAKHLRRLAGQAKRRELATAAQRMSWHDRRLKAVLPIVAEAGKHDPTVLLSRPVAQALLSTAVGERGRSVWHRVQGAPRQAV